MVEPRARVVLGRADLLVAVGRRFTEVFTAEGSLPLPRPSCRSISIQRRLGSTTRPMLGLKATHALSSKR